MNIKRAKGLIIGFVLVLTIVGLFLVGYLPARGAQRQLDAIRAAGLPASPIELDAWYKSVPATENQALSILQIVKVDPPRKADPNSPALGSLNAGEPLSIPMLQAIQDYLQANRSAIQALHEAAKLTEARYPMDLAQGANTLLPHLARVKGLAQVLRVDVVYQSHLGKLDAALGSIKAGFALARSLRQEPLLISELVRISCVALTLRGLERLLSEHQLSREQLMSLGEQVASTEAAGREAFFRALVGERASGLSVFQMPFGEVDRLVGSSSPGGAPDGFRNLGYGLYRASGMHQRDLSLYLEMMERYVNSARGEFPLTLQEAQKIETEMTSRFTTGLGRFAVLSRMLLPSLSRAATKEASLTARLRCAQVALAIEQFRLDHAGALPKSLTELTPKYLFKIPLDPFDGAALSYEPRSSGQSYRIVASAASADRKRQSRAPADETSAKEAEDLFSVLRE